MSAKFIHLNLHTEYSISDSIIRIDQLMDACCKQNIPAVALTDQSNLFALVKFYKAAIAKGVKPIIGTDIWFENPKNINKPFKLTLFAQNNHGYKNILKLLSLSFVEGQHLGIPIVKKSWLEELSANLIALSGGKDGDVGQSLLADDLSTAKQILSFWLSIFPDRYYLELIRTGRAREEEYLYKAVDLSVAANCPVVATNAVRFLHQEDFEAHEARVCIHGGHILNDPNRPHLYSEQQYLRTQDEMIELFADISESLVNSVEIAKRCNVELNLGETYLPIFPVPEEFTKNNPDSTPENYLIQKARDGLDSRLKINFATLSSEGFIRKNEQYLQRLKYEIEVIIKMGFASYFLIVADFIVWAKQNGVPVGPGRGSGAGSLVAYVLGITDVDPIKHELLFERFLNPERISLPDFDVDFCVGGRDRVIEYVVNRYGKNRVAQIITYGTMAARAVVRDIGRVLGYPYGFVDKIAKLIPFEIGISLDRALEEEELLRQRYSKEDEVKTLIDLAKKLEGITRNASKHAGGVVIAPSELTDFMPLYCESATDGVITQFDKDDVEIVGLVKFDFLGLRNLTVIDLALQNINTKRKYQNESLIDINLIPLDDERTYKLLQSGDTTAVFQLESRISRDIIKRFKPDRFTDLVALVAIIRPGVLQSGMLDEFINRKNGRSPIVYLHPKLESILHSTYGIIVYQEQVVQMAQILANYSLGSGDLLRRAMGKKKPEEMARQRAVFLEGAAINGVDKHLANSIFDLMENFASYGFNKSHSAAYALISYQTAWLKAHYPAEFMAAVLSSDMDNTDKIIFFLADCKKLGLKIISPDINTSNYQFIANNKGEILYGLGAIKGVGQAAVEIILRARKDGGGFKDLFDLCRRVNIHKVNKRVLEALIYSGSLDNIGPNRASLIATLGLAMRTAEQFTKNETLGQLDLFGELFAEENSSRINYLDGGNWNKEELLQHEKSVLGYYLNGHPIEPFKQELDKFVSASIAELSYEANRVVLIAGFVKNIKIINTKSNKRFVIINIEDITGSIDVTMFSESFDEAREYLIKDQLAIVEGKMVFDNFSGGFSIRAHKAMNLEQARLLYVKGILLKLNTMQISDEKLGALYKILNNFRGGQAQIFIGYNNEKASAKLALGDTWKVQPKNELLTKLKEQFGNLNISLIYSNQSKTA